MRSANHRPLSAFRKIRMDSSHGLVNGNSHAISINAQYVSLNGAARFALDASREHAHRV